MTEKKKFVDLACLKMFADALKTLDKKTARKIFFGTLRPIAKKFIPSMRRVAASFHARQSTPRYKHSVYTAARLIALKSVYRPERGQMYVSVGTRKIPDANLRKGAKTVQPSIVLGRWLNGGVRSHSIPNRRGYIKGWGGNDWVKKTWDANSTGLDAAVNSAVSDTLADVFGKTYHS